MFGALGDQDAFGANWNLDEIQQLEDITAGGFLEDDAVELPDEAGNKEKIAPSRHSMMPVKISMIVNAWQNDTGYIQFFNKVPDILKIVGRVEKHKTTEENTQFLIDDGTGRIPCIYVHTGTITPFRQSALEKVMKSTKMVAVYGSYNPIYSVKCPVLVIYKIREIYAPDEYALHELDVVNLILRNEKEGAPPQIGDPLESMPAFNAIPSDMPQNATVDMPAGMQGNMGQTLPSHGQADAQGTMTLTKYVAQLLAEETRKGNLNGLNITEITRRCKLQRNFQSISEQHVRKVLTELEKDATVYQTVDAHTYASTDA
ncbi:hypothetical protein BaOVIS_025720 [Babesia ovis]|uniref:Replication protein A C-terminal domain-containing protein n=1 Tax=Babesia ovis TaxID=5869 RepID=A0A9W5WVP3_BABOV|nr:hypothetical protein BaOVIS_025720 [Babesia ovis]